MKKIIQTRFIDPVPVESHAGPIQETGSGNKNM